MKTCPGCGIERKSIDTACMVCGYDSSCDRKSDPGIIDVTPTGYEEKVLSPVAAEIPARIPPKKRLVYIVLALLFGMLGIHNFYAERNGQGMAQLLIFVCLIWACGIGGFVNLLWIIIDIVSVNTDGKGVQMV